MFRVFTVAQQKPGVITLLASPEEWQRVADHIRTTSAPDRQLYRLIARADMTGPVVRLTFPDEQGRRLLQSLGLAS